jgi:serine/threonine-protein kinase
MIKSDSPTPGAPGNPGVDPLIGRTLNGRFSITEAIGVGGMGKVYRAMQAPLDRVVALKVLNPSYSSTKDPGFQQRFLREASLTSKLRHPNTVTVIDYGQTDDGIFYIAMEYLEGRTLAQVLSQTGPLPWSRVINIAQQVCRSLREAHGIGIVHRDLKPANIILLNEADQDLVKVLDFGLVKSIAPVAEGEPLNPEITQSGTFLGSPQYMAPEQARNVADARSDIYSLGVVLYQMLQGRPPFVARDHLELIFAHCKEPPPPFNSLRPYMPVPAEIEAVVMRCLEKDPARRFQSMDELLETMRSANMAAGGHSGIFKRPGGATTTGPHPSPLFASAGAPDTNASTLALDISVEVPEAVARARRRRLMGVALASVVGIAGLGGAFLFLRPAPTPAEKTQTAEATTPTPAPVAPPTPEPQPAAATPQMVRLRLMSEPTGARVYYKGKERGTTPFVLEVPPGPDGTVTTELTFALEGYQTETVITGGSGDVVLSQKLQKRRGGSGVGTGSGTSAKVEFAGGTSDLEPATAMPTSLSPAEPIAPLAPAPTPAPTPAPQPSAAPPQTGSVAAPPSGATLAAASNRVLPYMEGMSRPEQLSGKDIAYTREALDARVEGTMVMKCTITREGSVQNCRAVKALPYMENAVIQALESRTYKPITYQGQPVAVEYVFKIRLTLPKR